MSNIKIASYLKKNLETYFDAWDVLSGQLSPLRSKKMQEVASNRTNYIRLVLQDVNNPHNISACIRSAEALGIQTIDVVCTSQEEYIPSTVAKGCSDWLTINTYVSIEDCAKELHKQGYLLACAMPSQDSCPLSDVKVEKQALAIIFGNENHGVSQKWRNFCDIEFTIPMCGFVESFNISVGAALTMYHLINSCKEKLSEKEILLSNSEQKTLLNTWIMKKLPNWEKIYHRLKS